MGTQEDIEQLACAFIAEAFSALEREHIIPTPVYHPYVSVGRDYYGETLRGVEGYRPLEEALERAYPARFAEPAFAALGERMDRLMLADEPEVIWALDEDSGVDAALADDQLRAKWRKGWHMRLDAIKAGFAAERARPAVSSISQDDQ